MMKTNKRITALVAALLIISIAISGTYAWYMSSKESTPVNVSTSSIDIILSEIISASNKLPGEVVQLNSPNMSKLSNSGNNNAILQLLFDGCTEARLPSAPPAHFRGDYDLVDGIWYLDDERLAQVVKFDMLLDGNDKWMKIDGGYYAVLKTNSSIELGEVIMEILGELGGNFGEEGDMSESRDFEMGTVFDIQYKVTAIQATRSAVSENWGQKISDAIPIGWYN
ncbi:MAG: hypothetical protein LBV08_06650 [Clostridiales bacterium]|nr:hypothetical protein [Clostridiales bacterium]